MKNFGKTIAATAGLLAILVGAAPAYAAAILNFGGDGTNVATLTNNGSGPANGASTLTVNGANITISFIEHPGVVSIPAFFQLNASSQGGAQVILGQDAQLFTGSFCVSSVAGCGGIIYLQSTVNFLDATAGAAGGLALNMGVTDPPDILFFTNNNSGGPAPNITSLGLGTAMSLGLTNGSQPLAIFNNSLGASGNTTYQISGNFSANIPTQVPEPATLLLLGGALAGLGLVRRRKQS